MMQKNMRGFIFTLDALFALIVSVVGISLLLYVNFTSPSYYAPAIAQAQSLLQSMQQTSLSSSASSSQYISLLATSANSSVDSWPQFAHDGMLSSSTSFAEQYPFLLYKFNASANILPYVAVDSGIAALAAGSTVYILNASDGALETTIQTNNGLNLVSGPALYRNMVIYANSGNVIAANPYSGAVLWSFSPQGAVITPLSIENSHLVFGTASGIYLLNPINGSVVAYAGTQVPMQLPIYVDGEYIVPTNQQGKQNSLYSYVLSRGNLYSVWNAPLSNALTTQPTSMNNTVGVGSGLNFYIFSTGGKQLNSVSNLPTNITGVSAADGGYYVETTTNMWFFNAAGIQTIFGTATPVDLENSTPSVGPGVAYTVVNGNLIEAYNTTSYTQMWNMSLPSTDYGSISNIALAYGNMYVPSGNVLYVFGTYKPQPGDSILQALTSMYLSNQGDYSDAILMQLYNSSMSGIFINGTYGPSLGVAEFNAVSSSYIEQADGFGWANGDTSQLHLSFSVWVDPTSANGVIIDGLGQISPNTNWHHSILELVNGILYYSIPGIACVPLKPIPLNKWSNIVVSWTGSALVGYVNGVEVNNTAGTMSSPGGSALMYYPIGVSDISGNCGSGSYYSGSMLDYQIYNTTLGSQDVMTLYNNGPGSAPLYPTKLVLWWPLEGNPNDFSGMFNIGISHGVVYAPTDYTPRGLQNAYQVSKATIPVYINSNGMSKEYYVSVYEWR